MNRYSPIATLVAVVLLGAGLLRVNVVSNPGETARDPQATSRPVGPTTCRGGGLNIGQIMGRFLLQGESLS